MIYDSLNAYRLHNIGFCLLNDLYADCAVVIIDTDKKASFHSYVIRDGKRSEFWDDIFDKDVNINISGKKLDFAESDLCEEQGWQDELSGGVGMFHAWDMELEWTDLTLLRAKRHLPHYKTQTGIDIRDYKHMKIEAMVFKSDLSANRLRYNLFNVTLSDSATNMAVGVGFL